MFQSSKSVFTAQWWHLKPRLQRKYCSSEGEGNLNDPSVNELSCSISPMNGFNNCMIICSQHTVQIEKLVFKITTWKQTTASCFQPYFFHGKNLKRTRVHTRSCMCTIWNIQNLIQTFLNWEGFCLNLMGYYKVALFHLQFCPFYYQNMMAGISNWL